MQNFEELFEIANENAVSEVNVDREVLLQLLKDSKRFRYVQENIYNLPYEDHGAGPEFDLSNDAVDKLIEVDGFKFQ